MESLLMISNISVGERGFIQKKYYNETASILFFYSYFFYLCQFTRTETTWNTDVWKKSTSFIYKKH